jgi:hypothetical protein
MQAMKEWISCMKGQQELQDSLLEDLHMKHMAMELHASLINTIH